MKENLISPYPITHFPKLTDRKAKIITTLGPASSSIAMIEKLINMGADVARVNMSHGTHETHRLLINNIRHASSLAKREIGILLDLQGPKIRVSKLVSPLELVAGDEWYILSEKDIIHFKENSDKIIPTTYEHFVQDVEENSNVLFDDGLLEAVVISKNKFAAKIKIKIGGLLKSNKGINLPNVKVSAPSLTEKDEQDLYFGIKNGADYIALSFVREAEDILKVRYILHQLKIDLPIISKIEKPEALVNLDDILKVTDIIMIARGDMGVEVGNHLVPSIQKNIIAQCNARGVPVITATQMLESMITNPRPTRAEASDVANAIWDGTDAVMLSAESASGQYPIEAVQMMNDLVIEAERTPRERPFLRNVALDDVTSANQVAASLIAEKINAKWIIALTERARSCLKMTRFRPRTPVLGVTQSLQALRRMGIYWGTIPYFFRKEESQLPNAEMAVIEKLKNSKLVHNGDKVVITHGDGSTFKQGTANSIRVELIKGLKRVDDNSKVSNVMDSSDYQIVETQNLKMILDIEQCSSCQNCIGVCPFGIWSSKLSDKGQTRIDKDRIDACTLDSACVEICPTGAIELIIKS